MKIRGVLLDKDGTILDYARTWVPINREVALFAAGGHRWLADELLTAGGHDPVTDAVTPGSVLAAGSLDDITSVFARRLGGRAPRDLAWHIDRLFREGGARHSVLVAGALVAMQSLGAMGLSVGIATNDTIGGLEASLGRHAGVLDLCAFRAGCDSGFGAKPGPGMVHAFAAATGVPVAAMAVVGDAVHDLEMGARARVGLKVAVLSGTGDRGCLAPFADVVLGSIAELPELLRHR